MSRMDEADPSAPDRSERTLAEHYILLGFSVLALVGVGVLGFVVDPDPRGFGTHEQFGLAPCRTMEWAGIPCPGCGVTTSVSLLWHGHLWDSFVNQPFGFLLGVLVPLVALGAVVRHFRGHDLYADATGLSWGRALFGLGSLLLLAWVYKIIQL